MARTRTQVATPDLPPAQEAPPAPAAATETRAMLAIDLIDPNTWNPRPFSQRPDPEDRSLTASIAQHGVLQNLLVRPLPDGRHQLIFGERRLRCARAAGLVEVPVTARSMDDHEARVLTVTENLQRKQLHFLDEAAGVSVLLDDEQWTVDRVAAKLDKPPSWVARRHRLLNLAPPWSELARAPEPWTAGWSDRHFEQIAVLEADAQDELLTRDRHQLEDCVTVRDLARLIGSRTRALSTFPWPLDDGDLDPAAGACSACPRRSSRHPGLFDDQERDVDDPVAGKQAKSPRGTRGDAADRCLDPLCAARKGALLVARKKAELAARHPDVVLLQDGYLPDQIPGALRFHQVEPAKKGAPGAVAAVVANGPNLGQVKWVKPRLDVTHRAPARAPGAPPSHKSLAERQEQKHRQRQVHAIGLLKTALLEQAPPALLTSVRLAVVFGTAQRHASSAQSYDTALPRVAPDTDSAAERRRMLGHSEPAAITDSRPAAPAAADDTASGTTAGNASREGAFWHTFDALEGQDAATSGYLWARTLAVMLDRMTPNADWRHVAVAWHEAKRVAALVGLQAQDFLDRATAALPDPKSWAKERPAAASTLPSDSSAGDYARPSAKGSGPATQGSPPRALRAAPRLSASRLPR